MSNPTFRFPNPRALIERYVIAHPAVPRGLEGLSILHLSDLHIAHAVSGRSSWRTLLRAVEGSQVDLAVLTGDYMTGHGDELHAARALRDLLGALRARLGVFGIFGNHDSPALIALARAIPGIRWLCNEHAEIASESGADGGLTLLGLSEPEDLLAAVAGMGPDADGRWGGRFVVVLAHTPSQLFPAAEMGLPLVLLGHTHGGQVRLGPRWIGYTAGEVPGRLANGIVRCGGTIGCISRGLGVGRLRVRINCPAQAPLYVLRRGDLPGTGGGRACERLLAW